ncbi:hypothetical protein [Peterkaempfera bronchialis]|uniref:Uncharacterized protein n=1 Tax=Peterkaempfera bronchialis TaxID=2126346 RepID=A0A345SZ34_9ACTN|nr:hypothetical protein [Peterkaempfera bronchialis]AXI78989.1 hypothetical protein C7M71_017780 [Peterkaempfera bronchialis]
MTASKRPGTVPYIASWSGEKRCTGAVVEDRRSPGRIAYRDERPDDRDEYGVLWARADSRPTRGRPQYGLVHPRRQRHAMRNLRCQVCDGPADTDERGTLWLLGDDRGDWPGWPEEMAATTPPLCLPCARLSVRLCPHLRGRHIAVRVRNPEIAGVYGALYLPRPDRARPTAATDTTIAYTDPAVCRVLAAQQVMRLRGCTLVDLPG